MRAVGIALLAAAIAALATVLAAWVRRGPGDRLSVALLRFINESFLSLWHGLRQEPGSPIPPVPLEGPAIVVANHRSAVDPLALAASTRRVIQFLMAREYYETPGLRWLFRAARAIPVNRDGSDLGATKAALNVLREGGVIGIFPQGGIREASESELGGKAGVALLALRTGAPVIPAYITGTPALESVFLSILIPSRSRVRFGEPLRLSVDGKKATREEIDEAARTILERIAELRPGS